jgi:hypothetical protein
MPKGEGRPATKKQKARGAAAGAAVRAVKGNGPKVRELVAADAKKARRSLASEMREETYSRGVRKRDENVTAAQMQLRAAKKKPKK